MRLLVAAAMVVLTGCAQTTLYGPGGKRIANLQGDYTGLRYNATGPGYSVSLQADTVSHSAATKAQGDAAHSVLGGAGTLTTAVGTAILTSGVAPLILK